MPGADDRTPSPADRPPASRVADELAQAEERLGDDISPEEMAEAEAQAIEAAKAKGWDHPLDDTDAPADDAEQASA